MSIEELAYILTMGEGEILGILFFKVVSSMLDNIDLTGLNKIGLDKIE